VHSLQDNVPKVAVFVASIMGKTSLDADPIWQSKANSAEMRWEQVNALVIIVN